MSKDYEIKATELVWPGKRTEVERVSLPFQIVETVNKPRVDQPRFDFGGWPENYPRDWKNKLIWGDNKYVMVSLLKEFAGKIDLIYIDPPFATGADFTYEVEIGDTDVTKEASVIEELAYRDTWGSGMSSYLQMMYERLVLMKDLLAEEGSIYVHCDPTASHYLKILMDGVFGVGSFRNEIVWRRLVGGKSDAGQYGKNSDRILFYTVSDDFYFDPPRLSHHRKTTIRDWYNKEDERGRYVSRPLTAGGSTDGDSGQPWRGRMPTGHWTVPRILQWRYEKDTGKKLEGSVRQRLEILADAGYIDFSSSGNPSWRRYLDEARKPRVHDIWADDDVKPIGRTSAERLGYPTQKPEDLLERIILASSKRGDLTADFFCGAGTTGAVAEKLGRRWIMSDLSRFAIQTTRKRLLNLHVYSCASSTLEDYDRPARPFEILNMGNYQKQKFIDSGHPPVERYIAFILKLYRGESLDSLSFIHGKKGRRLVHVAGVDNIVTEREVRDTVEECVNALGGKAVDILGWDFEMGLDELVERIGQEYGIDIRLVQIPRETLELKSADEKIRFFDMNYLEIGYEVDGNKLIVELEDFIIANTEYLPDEVQETVDSFTDYIDYWAVDFDYQDDTFHNMWQTFRTRNRKKLDRAWSHTYSDPGLYKVFVKVIDVFGNDTNKLLEVEVE